MILLVLIVGVLSLGIILQWIYRQQVRSVEHLPKGQPCYPLLGNAHLIIGKSDKERFRLFIEMFQSHDRLFTLWAGPRPVVATCHPDLINQIVANPHCIEKPFLYDFTGFTNGIFSTNWKLWKVQRKALNPAFNTVVLNSFIPTFSECSSKMVEMMDQVEDGATVNIVKYSSICTLEMICATSLGSDVLQREGKEEFVHSLDVAFNCAARRMLSTHLYPDILYRYTKDRVDLLKSWRCIGDFFSKIIAEKRVKLSQQLINNNKNVEDLNEDAAEQRKSKIYIERLMTEKRAGEPFSEIEIFDNTYHIITGGNDTSALEIGHACLFLAMFPDVQEKLYSEIVSVVPLADAEITPAQLNEMEYMAMFLKECLRHCPVVPNIARICVEDVEVDGTRIPKGTMFAVSYFALHRRKDFWGPDADKFDPENFTPEKISNRNPNAYLPFSGGPRNCIGGRYALISMKIMLIHILRKFLLRTSIKHQDLRYRFDMTLKLAFDPLIQLERRK